MNKIEDYIYNLKRNYAKNILTGNLGKVIEEEDKLICYVSKNKCLKNRDFIWNIFCNGIVSDNRVTSANEYNINKPIYYIIDGIDFGKHVIHIYGYDNVNVIIRNCKFPYGLFVSINGDCLLEKSYVCAVMHNLLIGADNITIKDMYIYNELRYTQGLDIKIGADNNLNIIDSNIGRLREKTNVSLEAGNILNLDNSDIRGDIIECEAKKIVTHHASSLLSDKKAMIKSSDFEPIKIESPEIFINGYKFNSNNKTVYLKQKTSPLSIKRLELIELLRQVRDKCENVNSEDIQKYQEELNNRSVIKTMKKG